MKIIPAIDIMGKKVVRLEQGKFDKRKIYFGEPVSVAQKWAEIGARILHVVDLDGARSGKPVNLDVAGKIAETVNAEVEFGGGLRSEKDVESAFRVGVRFAVVGTSAVKDAAFCRKLAEKFKDKVIFAVDVRDGKVAIKGWKEVSGKDTAEYLKELEKYGAKHIIYTDISRDGMMAGPNLKALKSVLQLTSLEVTASGGISSIDDIKILKELEPAGLSAVIVGKALYEGKLELKEALDAG